MVFGTLFFAKFPAIAVFESASKKNIFVHKITLANGKKMTSSRGAMLSVK